MESQKITEQSQKLGLNLPSVCAWIRPLKYNISYNVYVHVYLGVCAYMQIPIYVDTYICRYIYI